MNDEGAARIRALAQIVPGGSVLDLGAGNGEIAAELAVRGAAVTAVEGRAENAADIRALRDQRRIPKASLEVLVSDVRSLEWDVLGEFDVVVCSGLLYHLPLQDALELAKRMHAACRRMAVIDTEVAWGPLVEETVEGRRYAGLRFRERPGRLSALDDQDSFWLTRASLHALLHDAGFASSWELGSPGQPRRESRATVVAYPGERVERLELEPDRVLPDARPDEPSPSRLMRARLALARLARR
jgi:SAM-dependent methyltransferase